MAGSVEAQFQFGRMHDWGIGAKQDYKLAAYWYKKSAGKGYPKAQLALGKLYEHGKGVGKDRGKAESLYLKANAYIELLALRGEGAIPSTGYEATGIPAGDGVAVPNHEFHTLEGRTVELIDLRGKWVILNFWATWCPPCRKEMSSLESFLNEKENRDVVVLLVSIDEAPEKAKAYVKNLGVTRDIYHDPALKAGRAFMLDLIPTTYIIDPNGKIKAYAMGYRDWMDPVVKGYMNSLFNSGYSQ